MKEKTEQTMVMEALEKAKNSFNDYLDKECDLDPAYFRLQMQVEFMDSSFKEILEKITWEDKK